MTAPTTAAQAIAQCARALADVNAVARSSVAAAERAHGIIIARPDDEFGMVDVLAADLPHWYTGPMLVIDGSEPRGVLLGRAEFCAAVAVASLKFAADAVSDPELGMIWVVGLHIMPDGRSCMTQLPRGILFVRPGDDL